MLEAQIMPFPSINVILRLFFTLRIAQKIMYHLFPINRYLAHRAWFCLENKNFFSSDLSTSEIVVKSVILFSPHWRRYSILEGAKYCAGTKLNLSRTLLASAKGIIWSQTSAKSEIILPIHFFRFSSFRTRTYLDSETQLATQGYTIVLYSCFSGGGTNCLITKLTSETMNNQHVMTIFSRILYLIVNHLSA